ncbi:MULTISPECIES: MOSC domain-containing protein [unclassified Streptomyces]|uniref:MOSC domain-containing protein n=1 Tax=unclassified Streptomyces TaxID=2593676 RepID=UPI002DD852E2|nr:MULTISPECIES: MOSC domain-containing protein [unclassified Streptomyces]WSA92921.1 MOSC domain-containing protein [Streptomyces sp. NBC_01795]WSB77290.1 MOSC domain-containing protein [Streptomyces sp. NBC_01775]WSS14445.1 MOSC domain-containing protein [Streptomyces sp. NBC_01186]WSS43262.1 MOSC domain-containing protein [Streptomyces sp. NBC_01187]
MQLLSVNIGRPRHSEHSSAQDRLTGIDKQPTEGPVAVSAPGPRGAGGSGLAGDAVCDLRHHGGNEQAVYAFAREELDFWERELDRKLPNGVFGENLTTTGVAVDDALIGERWRVGAPDKGPLLEVCSIRIPCRTFAGWLEERGWMKRFMERRMSGAYLRVIEPGEVCAGDPVEVVHRPAHQVSVSLVFRSLTREPELLPLILEAGDVLDPLAREVALRRTS